MEAITAITGVVVAITGVLTLLLEWKKYKDKQEERQGRIIPPPSPRQRQSSSFIRGLFQLQNSTFLPFIFGLLWWIIWLLFVWQIMLVMIICILTILIVLCGVDIGSDFFGKVFATFYFLGYIIGAYPVGRHFQKKFPLTL